MKDSAVRSDIVPVPPVPNYEGAGPTDRNAGRDPNAAEDAGH